MRGPFTRWPRTADAVLAAAVLVAALFSGEFQDPETRQGFAVVLNDLPLVAYPVAVAGSGVIYWRRQLPLAVFGATVVASIIWLGLGAPDPLLAVLVALYSVGRYTDEDRWSYAAVGVALLLGGLSYLAESDTATNIGIDLLFVVAPWYLGRRLRIRSHYLAILREQAKYLERERAAETQRALADERTRIARELHDIVAHRVSMMTVQAGAAKTVAGDDPDAAYQAMEAVEQAGRQALGELRHLLGVLRPQSGHKQLGIQPGLAEIPRLVDQLGETGLAITLTTEAVPASLPARVDLSAYRIVQEALTNVLKHADPQSRAEVTISSANGVLVVEIANDGVGSTSLPGSGSGILGMRERAQLLGGTLEAGPLAGGGFRVVARLPIGEEPT